MIDPRGERVEAAPAEAPPRPSAPRTRLAGWGAHLRSECVLREPETEGQIAGSLDRAGTIARGLGRSYGDAALNAERLVLGMKRMNRLLTFDDVQGILTCEAGVTLAEIIDVFTPRGWFPMITPGTKFVTVGGCIANDVHGKAHHAQGAFSACVDAMTVLLASGEVVVASREENADLFWGTFGGMGLLGVVLTATLRLRKIETSYFRQKKIVVDDLEAMMDALDENDQAYPYSVATLDVMATGARLGRGVLVVGDHATREELPPELASDPLKLSPSKPKLEVPFGCHLHAQPADDPHRERGYPGDPGARRRSALRGLLLPLDMIGEWNRGYGRAGFTPVPVRHPVRRRQAACARDPRRDPLRGRAPLSTC